MHITKMQGLGNDYIYLNCLEETPPDLAGLAVRLSDRHFGVGGDGLIAICPGITGDFSMEMYNADGSKGAMCGNGIRCVGKYVYDKGLTRKTCLTIDTGAGPRALELHLRRGRVDQVTVDMGEPRVLPSVELEAEGEVFSAWPVEVGNPHAVIFCPDPREVPLERVGPVLATRDFNLIPAMLQQRFKLAADRMDFPPVERRRELSDPEQDHTGVLTAVLCREGLLPFAESVVGARRLRRAVRASAVLTCAGSTLGVLLAYYLTSVDAYASLSPLNLLFYLLMWLLPVWFLSGWVHRY